MKRVFLHRIKNLEFETPELWQWVEIRKNKRNVEKYEKNYRTNRLGKDHEVSVLKL